MLYVMLSGTREKLLIFCHVGNAICKTTHTIFFKLLDFDIVGKHGVHWLNAMTTIFPYFQRMLLGYIINGTESWVPTSGSRSGSLFCWSSPNLNQTAGNLEPAVDWKNRVTLQQTMLGKCALTPLCGRMWTSSKKYEKWRTGTLRNVGFVLFRFVGLIAIWLWINSANFWGLAKNPRGKKCLRD